MLKAIILARVSTDDQFSEGHSIPAQLAKAREYVLRRGFEIKSEHQFDESSLKDKRIKFEKVTHEIRESTEKIALIVETVDRLQRSFKESVMLDALRKEGKLEIHFIRESLVVHQDSNSSEIQRWDLGVFLAKSYVLQISDNVKRSIVQKLRNGEYPTLAPFGYNNLKDEQEKSIIEPHPFKSKIVKQIYEWYSSGIHSMSSVTQKVHQDFNIKLQKSRVEAILKNPFYYGEMLWKGQLYPHKYPAIIDRDLFLRAQNIKLGYNKKPYKLAGKTSVLYRGLFSCGHCGCAYTVEKKRKKSGREYIYYRCTQFKGKCASEYVREEKLTHQLTEYFETIRIPSTVADKLCATLKDSHKGKIDFRKKMASELQNQFDRLENRIERLYEDKLDGVIEEDFYKTKAQEYRREQVNIKSKLDNLHTADEEYYRTAESILKLCSKAPEIFQSSKVEAKRHLIKMVLSNPVINDGKLCSTIRKPFSYWAKGPSRPIWGG